jgi:hypothetical protein
MEGSRLYSPKQSNHHSMFLAYEFRPAQNAEFRVVSWLLTFPSCLWYTFCLIHCRILLTLRLTPYKALSS